MEEIKNQLKDNFEEHKNLMQKIDDLKEGQQEILLKLAGLPEKIFEKADSRYASKTSEKVVYAMVGTVCTAVLLALVYLVIVK